MKTLCRFHTSSTGDRSGSSVSLKSCENESAREGTHQSTDHDDTDRQSVPQSPESNISVDPTHSSTERLSRLAIGIQLADHHIGRVRDHCTENTSEVSTGKSHSRLSALVVVGLLSWEATIDNLDNGLERGKLHHRVGDLAAPEWVQALVQTEWGMVNSPNRNSIPTICRSTRLTRIHPPGRQPTIYH